MKQLKALRLKRRLTLRALATRSGVSHHRIHRIERGADPRVSDLQALAKALHVRAWWTLAA